MAAWPRRIVVLTQENHTFDQVFGEYPGAAGLPADVLMPAGHGRVVRPYFFPSDYFPLTFGPPHSFQAIHREWDRGRLDGFVRIGGRVTMGRYRVRDVARYYEWARRGVLLDHYFCSVLGPTLPNRLYLVAGTSGGLRDDPSLFGAVQLDMETLFDQLTRLGVSWRYYVGDYGADGACRALAKYLLFCPLLWLPRFGDDPRLKARIVPLQAFFEDAERGTLPDVSFIAPSVATSGHPPLGLRGAMAALERVAGALSRLPTWDDTLLVVNFDEGGGFFDHMPPPVRDVFGPGFRVPCLLLSGRLAPRVDHAVFDHTSVLRFIEEHYGLPLLGGRTHEMNSLQVALPAGAGGRVW